MIQYSTHLLKRVHFINGLLVLALLLIGGLGFNSYNRNGLGFRQLARQDQLKSIDLAGHYIPRHHGWLCDDAKYQGGGCYRWGENPEAVVLGDSHAPMVWVGLLESYQQKNISFGMLEVGGCPPLINVMSRHTPNGDGKKCKYRNTVVMRDLLGNPSIKEFILVSRGPLYITGNANGYFDWIINFDDEEIRSKTNAEVFELGLEKTVRLMLQTGRAVTLVIDVPELNFDIKSCNIRPLTIVAKARDLCAIERKNYETRNVQYREIINRIGEKFPKIKIIDPSVAICDAQYCYGKRDDLILYVDDNHLSYRGAQFVFNQPNIIQNQR